MEQEPVRICVSVCEPMVDLMMQAGTRAAQVADLVELRLDCLRPSELESAIPRINDLPLKLERPVILTLRPAEQGGHRILDHELRLKFFSARATNDHYKDIELDLIPGLADRAEDMNWAKIICSRHDFAGVPEDIVQLYERMARTRAGILKIAAHANDVTDCLPVFRLLDRAVRDGRPLIGIAMGMAGIATRILGPSRGAYLTYAALDERNPTGPGQLTVAELNDVFRIRKLDRDTQITGLAGTPVAHSLSHYIHNAAFESTGLNAVYIPFDVQSVSSFLQRMVHPQTRQLDWNLRGLSVTAPHKSAVMEHLDYVDAAAREIGAVNTIVVEKERVCGYNTDAEALITALTEKLKDLSGARCAVIGAGGAARAALWGLQHARAVTTVFCRDAKTARPLAESFGARCEKLNGAHFAEFDVVINATPLGTRGSLEKTTPATSSQLEGARLAYDLVYNPFETVFVREARTAGCETSGGLSMLVNQAAKQFALWTGVEAPRDVMVTAVKKALQNG